jgi:hypothetical protein
MSSREQYRPSNIEVLVLQQWLGLPVSRFGPSRCDLVTGTLDYSLDAREPLDISPNMWCVREWCTQVEYFCCSGNTQYYHTLRIAQWHGAS